MYEWPAFAFMPQGPEAPWSGPAVLDLREARFCQTPNCASPVSNVSFSSPSNSSPSLFNIQSCKLAVMSTIAIHRSWIDSGCRRSRSPQGVEVAKTSTLTRGRRSQSSLPLTRVVDTERFPVVDVNACLHRSCGHGSITRRWPWRRSMNWFRATLRCSWCSTRRIALTARRGRRLGTNWKSWWSRNLTFTLLR